jgi:hypothetical protein
MRNTDNPLLAPRAYAELQVADTVVGISPLIIDPILQGVEKQASGRQPPVKWPSNFTGQARRAAFWKAQHIERYVSIYKSRATPDHGLRRRFSTPC